MRRRAASRVGVAGAISAGLLAVALTAAFSGSGSSSPPPASPNTLAHIAQKNREAATVVAAHQRLQAAAATHDANQVAAEETGTAGAGGN